jgi:diguanylate cyclase (GGDEF)-like protein
VVNTHARPQDLYARFGGEEFCLMVPDMDEAEVDHYFDRLRRAIAGISVELGGQTLRMTASIGVSYLPAQRDSLHHLITEADRQLYLAKAGGRNQVKRLEDQQVA